jgi:hypothetical protein
MNTKYEYVICDKCNTRTQELIGAKYTCSRCLVMGNLVIGYPSVNDASQWKAI